MGESNRYNGIVLVGPPGVGKGTQAELLPQGRYFHFSSGDMFRALISDPVLADSEIGRQIKTIDGGNFVKDNNLVARLAQETIGRYVAQGKFDPSRQYLLLDGIPRNVAQVPLIGEFVDVRQILYLGVADEEELVRRILKRGKTSEKPRADDENEERIRRRLDTYRTDTKPLLDLYDPDLIVRIDGSPDELTVNRSILERIVG